MKKQINFGREFLDCQEFAFQDYPFLANSMRWDIEHLDKKFKRTQKISVGTRILYLDDQERMIHFGIGTARETVISKQGIGGKTYEHSLEDCGYAHKSVIMFQIPLKEEIEIGLEEFLRRTIRK